MKKPIGEILVENFGVSALDINNALAKQQDEGLKLGEILIKDKKIEEKTVIQALAVQYSLNYTEEVDPKEIDLELLDKISINYAKQNKIIPMWFNDEGFVEILLADPLNYRACDDVSIKLSAPLSLI